MFRFDRRLSSNEEVKYLVDKAWNTLDLPDIIQKLSSCRSSIIQWTKEQHTSSSLIISQAQLDLDKALSNPVPNQQLIDLISSALAKAYKEDELFWRQRSRIQWLQGGDRN